MLHSAVFLKELLALTNGTETSVTSCQSTLLNIPEEHRSRKSSNAGLNVIRAFILGLGADRELRHRNYVAVHKFLELAVPYNLVYDKSQVYIAGSIPDNVFGIFH